MVDVIFDAAVLSYASIVRKFQAGNAFVNIRQSIAQLLVVALYLAAQHQVPPSASHLDPVEIVYWASWHLKSTIVVSECSCLDR